jgi:hypothetical protein
LRLIRLHSRLARLRTILREALAHLFVSPHHLLRILLALLPPLRLRAAVAPLRPCTRAVLHAGRLTIHIAAWVARPTCTRITRAIAIARTALHRAAIGLREKLIARQPAIPTAVELLQDLRRAPHLFRIDDAVMIRIQHIKERRPLAADIARSTATLAVRTLAIPALTIRTLTVGPLAIAALPIRALTVWTSIRPPLEIRSLLAIARRRQPRWRIRR